MLVLKLVCQQYITGAHSKQCSVSSNKSDESKSDKSLKKRENDTNFLLFRPSYLKLTNIDMQYMHVHNSIIRIVQLQKAQIQKTNATVRVSLYKRQNDTNFHLFPPIYLWNICTYITTYLFHQIKLYTFKVQNRENKTNQVQELPLVG